MLENITQKLGSVFDKLKGRGALSEKDVDNALGDVRKALLEADVAIEAVKTFLEKILAKEQLVLKYLDL